MRTVYVFTLASSSEQLITNVVCGDFGLQSRLRYVTLHVVANYLDKPMHMRLHYANV